MTALFMHEFLSAGRGGGAGRRIEYPTLLFLSRWRSLARRIWTPSCGFTVNYLIVRVAFVVSAASFTIDLHPPHHRHLSPSRTPPPACDRAEPPHHDGTMAPLKVASGCGGVFSSLNQTEGHSSCFFLPPRIPSPPPSLCLKYANEMIRRRRALQLN